jgi:hypothetical protein
VGTIGTSRTLRDLSVLPAAPLPTVSAADVTVAEGLPVSIVALTLTLSAPATSQIVVPYMTVDGSAQAGMDYNSQGGGAIFNVGDVSTTVFLTLFDDFDPEPTETFSVVLGPVVGATLLTPTVTVTIQDNDVVPVLGISSLVIAEGPTGLTRTAQLFVTLSTASAQTVSVEFSTFDGTALIMDNDYVMSFGTLVFSPGETTKLVEVQIIGDSLLEPNEFFSVALFNPMGGAILGPSSSGIVLIQNDD